MTRQEFENAVKKAFPGDQIVYYTGALMRDRTGGYHDDFKVIDDLGSAALQACEAGKVHLTQHRIVPFVYAYIATKRPSPHKPHVWIGCYAPDLMQHKPAPQEIKVPA